MKRPNLLFFGIIVLILCSPAAALCQTLSAPMTASPNAATLEKFTEIPVNMFTGTPEISIPIHIVKYGNIKVPIALKYHPGLIRPGIQPGWVGMGWDLECAGAITRTVRGVPDDLYGDPGNTETEPTNSYNAYYPVPGNSANFPESGSQLANDPDWDTQTHLINNFTVSPTNQTGINDIQADEFSFNFMGYTGTFYYSGPTLGWQVVSDDNIQVALLPGNGSGFLEPTDIFTAIAQFQPFQQQICNGCSVLNSSYQPNNFAGFVMTVPDGTQYYFGGVNATEFESVIWYGPGFYQFLANSWLLYKIVDPDKNEVDFTYQRTYPTCNLAFGLAEQYITASTTTGCSVSSLTYSNADTTKHGGHYEWPMYLSKISSPNETVSFSISPATCLRFPNFVLLSDDGSNVSPNAGPLVPTPYSSDQLAPSPVNGTLNNLQWEQLNSISVTNSASAIYRQFQFNYSNSPSQRLTLNSLYENDNVNTPMEVYRFSYNNVNGMNYLLSGGTGTVYYDGNGTDHWGFFNGQNLNGINSVNMYSARQTNPTAVTSGLLSQITYPTGGYTQFTWEPHDFSQVVSVSRSALVAQTGYAGGSRIKEIKSLDVGGAVLLDKSYIYKAGYTAGGNTGSLSSSGVLNGTPQYGFIAANRYTVQWLKTNGAAGTEVSIYRGSMQSLTDYSYTGLGSYIGYSEVAEVNADNSYTRYFFTNYGADANGVTHFDQPPAGSLGWVIGGSMDAYMPMSTLERERGKPTGVFKYSAANLPVEKTSYVYRSDAARFNSFIKLVDFNGIYDCNPADGFILETAREAFTYDYYPIAKSVISYDQAGNNPATSTENYTYNSNNMVSSKTLVNSRGETVVTSYAYPTDFTDATSEAMVAAHILSPILQTKITNNGNPVSESKTNYYSPYTGYYLPQTLQLQIANNTIETRQQVYQHDTHGNVQEESKLGEPHDVYLYGYNSQYLVAKITNSTYAAVTQAMSQNSMTQAQLDNAATSTDPVMRTLLNNLRTALPGSEVTTYTYSPVIGMTSETDPKGEITYYEYDSYGRLMNTKDHNGNIIQHYDYHYPGQ